MSGEQATEKIVVGVDGSPSSRQALRWASREAERIGGEVHAISVWTTPTSYGWLLPVEDLDWQGHTASNLLEKAVVETLGDAAAARVRREVVEGHAASRLLDAAGNADLLVVGSHGHSETGLLGSVTLNVVAHARCPVVVIHEEGRPDPEAALQT